MDASWHPALRPHRDEDLAPRPSEQDQLSQQSQSALAHGQAFAGHDEDSSPAPAQPPAHAREAPAHAPVQESETESLARDNADATRHSIADTHETPTAPQAPADPKGAPLEADVDASAPLQATDDATTPAPLDPADYETSSAPVYAPDGSREHDIDALLAPKSPSLIPEPSRDLLDDTHPPDEPPSALHQAPPALHSATTDEAPSDIETPQQPELRGEDMGAQYEYQGTTTAADEAVDEDVHASLLADEQILPTPGWDTTATVADPLDAALGQQAHVHEQNQHHSQSAAEPVQEQAQNTIDWGDDDADNPFGTDHAAAPESTRDTFDDWGNDEDGNTFEIGQREPKNTLDWGDDEVDTTFEGIGAAADESGALSDQLPTENNVASDNHVAGSGIAASQSTAIAQALQELKAADKAPAAAGELDPASGGQEDDIAALWQAALDDDEFLDDADSANPDSVDPSAFFADDGEGFLDDDAFAQQLASPTMPVPVLDSQGNTQGFAALSQTQPRSQTGSATDKYQGQSQPTGPAAMTSPQFFSSPQMASLPAAAPLHGAYGGAAYGNIPSRPSQRPAGPQAAQSFVDKARGGYASPYDLPEDIVKPRKRPVQTSVPPVAHTAPPPPPPRTSSIGPGPPPLSRVGTATAATGFPSPPPSSHSNHSQPSQPPLARPPTADRAGAGFFEDLPMSSKPRSRPSGAYTPAPSAVTPSPPQAPPARPNIPPPAGSTLQVYGGLRQPERLPLLSDEPTAQSQQLQPEQPSAPLGSRYSPAPPAPGVPSSTARFSPMPPSAPAAASRYSPAPASQISQTQNKYASNPAAAAAAPPGPRPGQPFLPRTSSPLAYQERPHTDEPMASVRSVSYQPPAPQRQGSGPIPSATAPPERRQSEHLDQGLPQNMLASPPRYNPYSPSVTASPESRRSQTPLFSPVEARAPENQFSPPRRAHTQSPGAIMKGPMAQMSQIERPTSAAGTGFAPMTVQKQDTRQTLHPAKRQFSTDLSFALPQDERAADGLERWKGCPIFKWTPSGSIVSSFPKQTPIYAAGHAVPVIKCTPGSITIHDTKSTFPLDDRDAKFPGPFSLKAKGKKKDVLAWMSGKIEDLERLHEGVLLDLGTPTLLKRRTEEKVVLWKAVRLLLEHDNKVESDPAAEDAIRKILLPNMSQAGEAGTDLSAADVGLQTEPVNGRALGEIRKHLLEGHREKAVWYAAEHRLWSHALLIASVAGPEVWKQVVQEFVRASVKIAGEGNQSLAALYEVFAGNWEESIDELVPPSARAGFQMISKSDTVAPSAKNPLDGLDQWRETLGLIISNRSNNDVQAIASLGRLLASYGRVEAAHTCFLFAQTSVQHGGADDAKSDFVLLGADHHTQPHELAINLDSIMLTEIYEFVLSLSPAPGHSAVIPHLQAYKLHHAFELAEHGLRNEAQAYCDSIGTAVKSSTRASPYYHVALINTVDELGRCLSQAPQTSSSGGWISKPSMDKVSGSMWKRFNTFVAGDDDDKLSNGSGAGTEGAKASGPFGRVSGETPTVSRSASSTDLYGAMAMNGIIGPPALGSSAPSKYAPISAATASMGGGRYAPGSSGTYAPSRQSLDSVRSFEHDRPGTGHSSYAGVQPAMNRATTTPYGAYMPQASNGAEYQPSKNLSIPRPESLRAVSDYRVQYSQPSSRRESVQSGSASVNSYEPRLSMEQDRPSFGYHPQPVQDSSHQPTEDIETPIAHQQPEGYLPPASPYEHPSSSYEPPASSYEPPASSYEPSAASYEPPASSYEPPTTSYQPHTPSYEDSAAVSSYEPPADTSSSYEPPSYVPYQPEPETQHDDEETSTKPKKSFMDDDDDDDEMAKRAAALKKAQADKEADEAFRKAAEADAARDSKSDDPGKKGWFGGWFGGKKDPNAAPGPIRAKLGEQSSFYYDPDLKKWVNKKGGDSGAETPAATPPPPRGPPSRSTSGNFGPPSGGPPGPPSRAASGIGLSGLASSGPPGSRPATAGSGTPGLPGPPSRMSTPAMTSPPIGMDASPVQSSTPPPGMNGGGPPSAPPSRPPTSMSTASSIDDLLGAPGPRKGGAAKNKKRGGRYVDVMAK
ncbi:hypothetical protein MBLNU459_g3554t1 [Dothideomycetes sp. NU459]